MPEMKRIRPLPLMFVRRELCVMRNQNFVNFQKFSILDAIIKTLGGTGEKQSFWCDINNLFETVADLCALDDCKGIRTYIASYDASLGKSYLGKLTIVICACKTLNEDINDSYYCFDVATQTFKKDFNKSNNWVKFYQDNKLSALKPTLNQFDPSNWGDSKSFFYSKEKIFNLLGEIFYQIGRKRRQVFGMNIHFGAYDESEAENQRHLIVGFTFAGKGGKDIYIEDMNDNKEAKADTDTNGFLKDLEDKLLFLSGQLDTGTPCPPNSNCPTNGLPKR